MPTKYIAWLAHSVEHETLIPRVVDSSPTLSGYYFMLTRIKLTFKLELNIKLA